MPSSKESVAWVTRWRCEMAAKPSRRGIWRLKGGGFFVRARATDPRTGKELQLSQTLRGERVAIREAIEAQDRLRLDARDRIDGKTRSRTLWSAYAASLFEAKVAERKIKSASSRRRWADTLTLLVPAFGMLYVDELRYADLVTWRDQLARWMRDGMPSRRKRDAGKNKTVPLSPVTANGWISILKGICTAMKKHFELDRDPAEGLEYFDVPRKYTREQPNALSAQQASIFLAAMKAQHPQHYAMVFLGFVTGARPSTLRPLRRSDPECDVLWDEGVLLLRRSNSLGSEIMDETKTALDQEIPLPPVAMRVLREHIAGLEEGPMRQSAYLFPSLTGGMRSRSVLDKPFRAVLKMLRWTVKVTPRGMRRTFNDLARNAMVHDVVTRAISGHQTSRMQRHYSTAQREEMREAVGKVISLATARARRDERQKPRRRAT
jgi:Phage integrase family